MLGVEQSFQLADKLFNAVKVPSNEDSVEGVLVEVGV